MSEFSMPLLRSEDFPSTEHELESWCSEEEFVMPSLRSEDFPSMEHELESWCSEEEGTTSLKLEKYIVSKHELKSLSSEDENMAIHHSMEPREHLTNDSCTIQISREIILKEIVKCLGFTGPFYDIMGKGIGYRAYVKVQVPTKEGRFKYCELYACSENFYSTIQEAKEEASEWLIKHLQQIFCFEINDMNWLVMKEFAQVNHDLSIRIEYLERKISHLKKKIKDLAAGWAVTLQFVHSIHHMACTVCLSAEVAFTMLGSNFHTRGIIDNTSALKSCISAVLLDGVDAMKQVCTLRD